MSPVDGKGAPSSAGTAGSGAPAASKQRRRVVITTTAGRQDAGRTSTPPRLPTAPRRRISRRRRLVRTGVAAAVVAAGVAWLVTSAGGGVTAPHVSVAITAAPTVTPGAPVGTGATRDRAVPVSTVPSLALPWAPSGESAVDIPAIGYRAQSGPEQAAPVASLTKIMTAYVILHDHPLTLGATGPRITVTPADAANFGKDTVTDQSNVQLKSGEVLTEYQMLEGLLVHSANDLAYSLACWDTGSVPAFVKKMNATAASLGLTNTHFADASGFDPGSVSTAADLLTVAAAAIRTPVFAHIVDMPAVTLPVAGHVLSYTPLVGTTDVVGVKTGFTNAAGGGDLLALRASTGGRSFLVLAAVIGQQGPRVLNAAAQKALAIARAASAKVQVTPVATAGEKVARLSAGGQSVGVTIGQGADFLYLPGEKVRQAVHVHRPHVGIPAGTVVGNVRYRLGSQRASLPARTASRLR